MYSQEQPATAADCAYAHNITINLRIERTRWRSAEILQICVNNTVAMRVCIVRACFLLLRSLFSASSLHHKQMGCIARVVMAMLGRTA